MPNLTYSGNLYDASGLRADVETAVDSLLIGKNVKIPVVMAGSKFCIRMHWTDDALLASFLRHHKMLTNSGRNPYHSLWSEMAAEANNFRIGRDGRYTGPSHIDPMIYIARLMGYIPHWKRLAILGGSYHEVLHYLYSCHTRVTAQDAKRIFEPRWDKIDAWWKYADFLYMMNNIADDVKIERRGIEEFSGIENSLCATAEYIMEKEEEARHQAEAAGQDISGPMNVIPWAFRDLGKGHNTTKTQEKIAYYKRINPEAYEIVASGELAPILERCKNLRKEDRLGPLEIALDVAIAIQDLIDRKEDFMPPPDMGDSSDQGDQGQGGDQGDQQQQGGQGQSGDQGGDQEQDGQQGGQSGGQSGGQQQDGQSGDQSGSQSGGQSGNQGGEQQDGQGGNQSGDQDSGSQSGDQDGQGADGPQEGGESGDQDGNGNGSGSEEGEDGDEDGQGKGQGQEDGDPSEDGDAEGSESGDAEGDSKGDSEGEGSEDGGKDGNESGDQDGDGNKKDANGQKPGEGGDEEGEADGGDPSKNSPSGGEGGSGGKEGGIGASTGEGPTFYDLIQSMEDDLENDERPNLVLDMNDVLSETLGTEEEELEEGEAPWNPLTTEHDKIEDVPYKTPIQRDWRGKKKKIPYYEGKSDAEDAANRVLKRVKKEISFLRANFRQMMRGLEIKSDRHGLKRGRKISPRNLVRSAIQLRHGQVPNRAFMEPGQRQDTSISAAVVLDQSGSMEDLLKVATKALIAISDPLDYVGAASLVLGFRDGDEVPEAASIPPAERSEYTRTEFVHIDVFKRFDEKFNDVKGRFVNTRAEGGTPMSDGIQYALDALSTRQEAHRIMFVITDGQPNYDHREVVKYQLRIAREAGIHIVGVGISPGASYVRTLFDDHVYCLDLQSLPRELVKKLKEILDPLALKRGKQIKKNA